MIDEGEGAPAVDLPAVVAGEVERVTLSDYRGTDVVILAFYPADFNPACDGEETDLDELDLFTMQKDVTVLAISGDSVYSHRAFADEYDLHIPLLADVEGEVAEAYGVAADPEDGYRTNRAVVVIAPSGDVEYAWSTDDLRQLPPVEQVREAVDAVGGTETALARYRVGHAHYVEGRRIFTSAMGNFAAEEWMMARRDFKRAYEEFEAAAAQFNTAERFAVDETPAAHFERAEDKAELLWQAAEWLAESADAFASGEGATGQSMRGDAEAPLEEARRYGEPLAPDDFPPDAPPAPLDEIEDGRDTFLPDEEGEEIDTSLDIDVDADAYADDDLRESVEGQDGAAPAPAEGNAPGDGGAAAEPSGPDRTPDGERPESSGDSRDGAAADGADAEEDESEADGIDEAELEEITAELEEQTEAAQAEHETAPETAEDADDEEAAPEEREEETDDEDVELDLTDPTEGEGLDPLDGEDEEEDGDLGEESDSGNHGVPDSL